LDEAGFMKDRAHWYNAWWHQPGESRPTALHIFPHWNDPVPVGQNVDVWAFTNADETELFLNGKSLGRKPSGNYSHAEWSVPYAPGTLVAKAYSNSNSGGSNSNSNAAPIAVTNVTTTGAPARLRASFKGGVGAKGLRGDGTDVALVMVEVLDSNGLVVPTASNVITFAVPTGSVARIVGTGNGDPADHTPDKSLSRPVFHGLALGVVQSALSSKATTVAVSVTAPGLKGDSIRVNVAAETAEARLARMD
jgi:beta-galactosidase